MDKKLVALVGRPNVGKSTLFNRLSIRKKAIVHDLPGVTRDRKYADAKIGPMLFRVVDTPGLEESEEGQLEYRMMQQTMQAIIDADLVCLIVDNISGVIGKFVFHPAFETRPPMAAFPNMVSAPPEIPTGKSK